MDQEWNFTSTTNLSYLPDIYCQKKVLGALIWTLFSVPCVLVGIPANCWLLWMLTQRMRRGLPNDVYTNSLAIMDLSFTASIPFVILNTFIWRNDLIYRALIVCLCLNSVGRPMLTVCTCMDCYLAVEFPITYRNMKHSKYRLLPCALVWCITVVFEVIFIHNLNLIISPLVMTPFVLSLPPIVFFDFAIIHALHKPDPSGRSGIHPLKQRAVDTVTYSLALITLAYLPPFIVFCLSTLMSFQRDEVYCYVVIPSIIPALSFSAIMPLRQIKTLGGLTNVMFFDCTRV